MLDIVKNIKANGIEYPIAFTLNVMESVQEKYGSMDKWSKSLEPGKGEEPNIKDLIWTFKEFINEGIDIENENKQELRQFVSHKQVGRIITAIGVTEISGMIQNLTVESVKSDDEKNTMTTQEQAKA